MVARVQPRSTIFNPLPVLTTESAEEYKCFRDDFNDELKPRGPLERHLVDYAAGIAWEIRRLNRVKTGVVNAALRPGLQKLLEELMPVCGSEMGLEQWTRELYRLCDQWFGDERDKKEVWELLEQFKLDEFAIEAAAIRFAAPDLEKIDRLITSLDGRLSKTLCLLAELRGGLGRQLHARIIDGKVLAIADASKKSPPTVA